MIRLDINKSSQTVTDLMELFGCLAVSFLNGLINGSKIKLSSC